MKGSHASPRMECSSRFNFDLPQFPFGKRAARARGTILDEAILAFLVRLLRPSKPLLGRPRE